jgi:hypothetical protein
VSILAHFVGESSMRKLPLVFVKKKTWESWISVFDTWERGVPKKVVCTRISANVSVSNKSIV